jgi:Flp pilus assembly protein TadB
MNVMPYLPPLAWSMYLSWLLFGVLEWREKKKKPYKLADFALQSREQHERRLGDSRGFRRLVRVMDRGAGILQLRPSYWERLDRRLELMGEKADGRETLALLLLRSMVLALPALAAPLFWPGWWQTAIYPAACAWLFRQELKGLELRYERWQKELVQDIPEVMDRLRICFAGGRDYLSALRQAQASSGPAMGQALGRLLHDIQTIGSASAFRLFAISFDLPAVQKLASALMLAVESGYGAAEAYFSGIEGELTALRQEAAEALVRTKPEKIVQLYGLLFGLAVAALLLKGWEIFRQVGRLFSL